VNPVAEVERFGVIMQPEKDEPTEAWGVLNPAIARGRDGELYLFARVVAEGNYSRIRMARVVFDDGKPIDLERLGFVLQPTETYEMNGAEGGCEDPRITFVPRIDKYVMAYTAFGPTGPRIALAISDDLFQWDRLGVVNFAPENGVDLDDLDNKDAFFFPHPVVAPDGSMALACVHRPMTGVDQDGVVAPQLTELPASIWVSYVPLADAEADPHALLNLTQHQLLIRPEHEWEHVKIGGGPPPVLTPCGWLLIHHGIQNLAAPGEPRKLRYCAGAFIVDRWDVRRVIWRSPEPVLIPDTEHEVFGIVNDVVFPTGVDRLSDDVVDVYYGMADARIGVCRMRLNREACQDGFIEAA
jgi:beta-1,2-mannobiose phosphorylase / 1,2-beta-oligomannan phosphorylase